MDTTFFPLYRKNSILFAFHDYCSSCPKNHTILSRLTAPHTNRPIACGFMENPFSTKFWTSIPFQFSEDSESMETLLEKTRRHPVCQIVGPHGSGKSTLLLELRKQYEASGENVRYLFFNDQQQHFPEGITEDLTLFVDGFEQLRFRDQCRLLCRSKRLMMTRHRPLWFVPILYRTKPQFSIFVQIVRQMVPNPPEESVLREMFERSGGNFRSAFFELYDCWESLSPHHCSDNPRSGSTVTATVGCLSASQVNPEGVKQKKAMLRQEMRAYLERESETISEKSRRIRDRLMRIETFRLALQSERLMLFVSTPLEMETTPFFANRSMIVPCCEAGEIVPMRIMSLDELEQASSMKILEPKLSVRHDVSRRVLPEQIDVVLVPGLAFDRAGNRLGRGKGYYDRFLRCLPADVLTIGVAWEAMVREQIPCEENDCPVKMIVTENEILFPLKTKAGSATT